MDKAKELLQKDLMEAYFESEDENLRLKIGLAVLALINLVLICYIAMFL